MLADNLPLDPGIPPWITAAFIALWLAIVVMAWLLWQRRRFNRRMRREVQHRSTSGRRAAPADDRQLGPGKDVEIW